MYIAAHHTIRNPDEFWRIMQSEDTSGEGSPYRVHKIIRNEAGDRAAVLWEAESISALQDWLKRRVGEFSTEELEEAESLRDWGL